MPNTQLIAWSSAVPGKEAEFHQWYETVHIPQVTELLSVVGPVRRYQLALSDGAPRFVAIYDLGDADPQTAAGELGAATASGKLDQTDTMDITGNPPQIQFVTSLS